VGERLVEAPWVYHSGDLQVALQQEVDHEEVVHVEVHQAEQHVVLQKERRVGDPSEELQVVLLHQ